MIPLLGSTSAERIAETTRKVGESVLFTNPTAIRIDAVRPATIWPASKHDLLLRAKGKKVRVFAIHYTYTNFSGAPVGVRPLQSLFLKEEPVDLDLKWPDGLSYPEIEDSNAAVSAEGITRLRWPELKPPERDSQTGGFVIPPGRSVRGAMVTYEIRPGKAQVRIEMGVYRQEGQASYLLDVPG
ncbi:MAG: hypothetical protein GEV11_29930 [Streptosporangiales bacterium]|nr:hypothetical protein [Streptosporangiales bacterium]